MRIPDSPEPEALAAPCQEWVGAVEKVRGPTTGCASTHEAVQDVVQAPDCFQQARSFDGTFRKKSGQVLQDLGLETSVAVE